MTDAPNPPTIAQLARQSGLSASLVSKRRREGWSDERIVSTPAASLSARGKMSRAKTKFHFQCRDASKRTVNVVPSKQ